MVEITVGSHKLRESPRGGSREKSKFGCFSSGIVKTRQVLDLSQVWVRSEQWRGLREERRIKIDLTRESRDTADMNTISFRELLDEMTRIVTLTVEAHIPKPTRQYTDLDEFGLIARDMPDPIEGEDRARDQLTAIKRSVLTNPTHPTSFHVDASSSTETEKITLLGSRVHESRPYSRPDRLSFPGGRILARRIGASRFHNAIIP